MKLEKPIIDGKSADAAVVRRLSLFSVRPTTNPSRRSHMREYTIVGYSLGSVLAVVLSVIVNKSIFWGVVHLWWSWAYVVWALIVHLDTIRSFFVSV